jgi:hypothetical protein
MSQDGLQVEQLHSDAGDCDPEQQKGRQNADNAMKKTIEWKLPSRLFFASRFRFGGSDGAHAEVLLIRLMLPVKAWTCLAKAARGAPTESVVKALNPKQSIHPAVPSRWAIPPDCLIEWNAGSNWPLVSGNDSLPLRPAGVVHFSKKIAMNALRAFLFNGWQIYAALDSTVYVLYGTVPAPRVGTQVQYRT